MKIMLNGKSREINNGLYVHELLSQLELGENRIAVEINQEIIPRSRHSQTLLREGDVIEVIHAIGGG